MTKDRKRGSKVKLVVSFNGQFHHHSPSRQLRYVGGDTKVISIDSLITFAELKSKIDELDVSVPQLLLLYTTHFSGCEKLEMGYIGDDDDVRRMIRKFEVVQGVGKSCRLWVFACKSDNNVCLNRCCDVKKWAFACKNENDECLNSSSDVRNWVFACKSENGECLNSCSDGENWVLACNNENGECLDNCSDAKNWIFACKNENGECLNRCSDVKKWGFGEGNFGVNSEELCGDYGVLRENSGTQLTKSEKDWNFIECSVRKFSVSEEEVSGNELDEIELLTECCLEENGVNLISGNECCDLSNDDSNLSFQKRNSDVMKIIESKCSNGINEENSNSGKISVESSDSSLVFNTNEKEYKSSREGIIRKEQDKDASASSKAYGRISAEIAACYNHLESIELQTIKYSNLEFIKHLGEGAYGIVYYGKWNGSDVAIKRVKFNCSTEGTPDEDRLVKDFWNETRMLGKLYHPNIVALYGVVTDGPPKYLAAVTEYMVNGSLKQVLQRRDRTIDRRKRVIIARDAASGMEYLHENNIVHFDLKSHNLLLNMRDPLRPVCKIGDLGLSKIKQRSIVSGGFRGTLPWMAPELFDAKSMVTEKVDVYSFAIVMWELLAGETPYANMRSKAIIAGMMKGDLRPETPSWCDPVWRSLMQRCWSSDPVSRPSFVDIVKELKAMAVSMNIK